MPTAVEPPRQKPIVPTSRLASVAPHLRVRGLNKRFGAFTALRDVSLDVAPGELVCFLGPSGCGKTTLLRAIAGLDFQDTGSIEIAGRDVSRLPPAARDFGIVFQSYALFPNLSVADNVGYGLVNRRMPKVQVLARVRELLSLVGLPEQESKYPVQLSGGQQQRVALARALATAPSLLLLDEPLSALDARVRVRLRDEIKQLQRRLGVTTVMVTHDQEEALAMADRIVVMNQGAIEQAGTPVEIYARPSSAFVADFVGTMTFMDGRRLAGRKVDIGGLVLDVARMPECAIGHPLRLGFRPEEIQVRNLGDTTPNRMRVLIARMDYLGSFCRARLIPTEVQGIDLIADFSANAVNDMALAEGDTLPIAISPESLRVFPRDASAPA